MADVTTTLSTQVVPEVMAAMISAQLPKAIRFTNLAKVDATLVGRPGDTITVPRFKYIGDATEFGEGEAIDYAQLTTETTQTTIKKAGIGVKLTDEALLSGYGDPRSEAARQISTSIASKVDNDVLAALVAAPLSVTAKLDLDLFNAIEDTFNDDANPHNFEDANPATGVLLMNPTDITALRKKFTEDWTRATDLGDSILVSGTLGSVFGWQIISSRKVAKGTQVAVKTGAVTIVMKRGVVAETARDIDHKLTKLNADEHYGVWLSDETRALVVHNEAPKA
jgi:N4-gp56 family major capsid protein